MWQLSSSLVCWLQMLTYILFMFLGVLDSVFYQMKTGNQAVGTDVQFGTLSKVNLWPSLHFIILRLMKFEVTNFSFLSVSLWDQTLASSDINLSSHIVGSQSMPLQKEPQSNLISVSSGHRENWGESNMAEASPITDTSTDDTEDKNQRVMTLTFSFEHVLLLGNN